MTKYQIIQDDEFYSDKLTQMLMNQFRILKKISDDCTLMTRKIDELEKKKVKKVPLRIIYKNNEN